MRALCLRYLMPIVMLETYLLTAAQSGNLVRLKMCIKQLQFLSIDHRNHLGQTALLLAAAGGHAQCVRLLLERGANPDVCDNLGQSPLVLAARRRNRECVRFLLESEATLSLDAITSLERINYPGISQLREAFHWKRRKALLAAYYKVAGNRLTLV